MDIKASYLKVSPQRRYPRRRNCLFNLPGRKAAQRFLLVVGLAVAAQAGFAAPAELAASGACRITQITNSTETPVGDTSRGNSAFSVISANGKRIAFVSDADLTGNNSDLNDEVFLYDRTAQALTQITASVGVSFVRDILSISADGNRVVFADDRDLTGDNPDGGSEIFLFDARSGALAQITKSSDSALGSFRPSISADGTRVGFSSRANFTGRNKDGNAEIFIFNISARRYTQITDSLGRRFGASIDVQLDTHGSRIAFLSNGNLTGRNADHSDEVFLFDTRTRKLTQITNQPTDFINGFFALSSDGARIGFASGANLTGTNPDGSYEIFVLDLSTKTLTQLTSTSRESAFTGDSALNANGTRIAFDSNTNPSGDNTDLNFEIFVFDANTNTFTQATSTTGIDNGNFGPSVSADGARVAFFSPSDPTGGNADGNVEIFLADCAMPGGPVMCGGREATIVGTTASETLNGTPFADVIQALGGNDVVSGRQGDDVICGGVGHDRMLGGDGNDREFGGTGNDQLSGQSGNDRLNGGFNSDRCDGGASAGDIAAACEQRTNIP